MAARAQLESELATICGEIRGENCIEDLHVYGLYHVITYTQLARIEKLVDSHQNKSNELSEQMFSTDPGIILAAIRTAIPAYEEGGKVQLGYAVRDSILKALSDLSYKEVPKREVEPSLPAAADPAVKAEFEQWYREEISTDPSDLEKWNNALYLSASTDQYFTGFIGGLGRRTAFAEAALAEQAQNVQPRLDALISQVTAQLERSKTNLASRG